MYHNDDQQQGWCFSNIIILMSISSSSLPISQHQHHYPHLHQQTHSRIQSLNFAWLSGYLQGCFCFWWFVPAFSHMNLEPCKLNMGCRKSYRNFCKIWLKFHSLALFFYNDIRVMKANSQNSDYKLNKASWTGDTQGYEYI